MAGRLYYYVHNMLMLNGNVPISFIFAIPLDHRVILHYALDRHDIRTTYLYYITRETRFWIVRLVFDYRVISFFNLFFVKRTRVPLLLEYKQE